MTKLKALALAHKWALGLAVLTSLIAAAPQVYLRIDPAMQGVYQGIELIPDSPWSARAREVMDGHPNFGAIYYKDGKDNPYLFQPLGSIVVGYTGQALGLDINNTLLLFRLLYVGLASLLIYAFVYLVSRRKAAALCAAALLLLAESVLSGYGLLQLLQLKSPDDFLRIARPVNPAMIYIFFFGFLTAFYKFYQKLDWRWGALAAVLLAANFYNYFYTWTYLYAFGGFLGLALLVRKQWEEAFKVAAVFITALGLAIPYMLNLYNATQHPAYEEVGMRNGILNTHEPLFIGALALIALIAYLLLYPRGDKRAYFFNLALLLAPIATLNQQLLTGKILQESHYHWFFHRPMAVIFGLILLFLLAERYLKRPQLIQLMAALIIAGSIGTAVFIQAMSYHGGDRDGGAILVERQKYGPAMRWLNEHAQAEEVVFANDEASHMVAIYTPLNLFFHRAGMFSLQSTEERLRESQYAFLRLRGVSAAEAPKVIYEERNDITAFIWAEHYRQLCGSYECVPQERIDELVEEYRAVLRVPEAEWFRALLQKYEVSYVLWDTEANPAWKPGRFSFLEEQAEFGQIVLYKVVR